MHCSKEKKFIKTYTTKQAPEGCTFKVGDIVTYKNEFGALFKNQIITGFALEPLNGRFIHLAKDAYWFPVKASEIKKQN